MAKQLRRTRVISFRIGAYRFHIEKHTWFYPPTTIHMGPASITRGQETTAEKIKKSLKKGYKAGRK